MTSCTWTLHGYHGYRQDRDGQVQVGAGPECGHHRGRLAPHLCVRLSLLRPHSQPQWQVSLNFDLSKVFGI